MANYSDYEIDIPFGKTTGQVRALCPKCSHTRKKKQDKCLSINLDDRVWNCKNCDFAGFLPQEKQIDYKLPPQQWKNNTDIDTSVVKYFEGRKISQGTLQKAKISSGVEFMPQVGKEIPTIHFNYFRDEKLVNIKYRGKDKAFKLFKDAELILYNLDNAVKFDEIYICEGEVDCLSIMEAGFDNVVSVPNGGSSGTNKFDYITNCIDKLFDKKRFIIVTDNDPVGRKLRYDLANRLGIEKCCYIEFEGAKDPNEYLQKNDLNMLKRALQDIKEFPMEGVFTVTDIYNEISDLYHYGLDSGADLHIPNFKLNIVKGYITTVVGIPSHGKSDWVDYMAIQMRMYHNWKGAFYSPENKPTQLHFSKIARKLIGKSWTGEYRMTPDEVTMSISFLDKNMWFIKPEKDFTLDTILASIKLLKIRHGLDYFVIDAWNKLEHQYSGISETKYIGDSLDKLAMFCETENLHCFLVVHPRKMEKEKDSQFYRVPTLYDCAGSANFYNKTDNGISVYRDFVENTTEIYIQKVKFSHWGEVSSSVFNYDVPSGRYFVDELTKNRPWIEPQR